jgi:hypothetical protein
MALGITILVLTVARFAVRSFTPMPERAATGSPVLDRIAVAVHYVTSLHRGAQYRGFSCGFAVFDCWRGNGDQSLDVIESAARE